MNSDLQRKIIRPYHLAEKIIFVTGLFGCGKTLFSALVSSYDRVEVERYNYNIEYACELNFLGKLSSDSAESLVKMLTDLDLYNLMMSRESNFRFSDLSAIWKHPRWWTYIKRLFNEGYTTVPDQIKKERPILNMVTHVLLPVSKPIISGLGDRVCFVENVRHPLYMIKQWSTFMDRVGQEARDFTVWFEYKGEVLPWYAKGIEEEYYSGKPLDRMIYSMANLIRLSEEVYESYTEKEKARIMFIPFEKFVLEPESYMKEIEILLDSKMNCRTQREMKKQNVPRKKIADGIATKIYKACLWEPSKAGRTERDELDARREFAAQLASPEAMKTLDRISLDYEKKYMGGLL